MLHTRLVCYAICMETVQTSYLMHVSLHTGSKSKLLSQYSLQMHEGAQTLTTMWITVLVWCWDSAQTSNLMRINGPAWRRLLVSCRKKTQQVSAETNCGHYCSLVSYHQGRTPGSTSGSSNSWCQYWCYDHRNRNRNRFLTANRIESKSYFSCIPSNDLSIEALDRL